MPDKELERHRQTLRRNRIWLQKLLYDPKRVDHELHLLVALRLRVLLCNGSDGPALIDYAADDRVDRLGELKIWGPARLLTPPFERCDRVEPGQAFPPYCASWKPNQRVRDELDLGSVSIDKYMGREVGIWNVYKPFDSGNPLYGIGYVPESYSPADLIGWIGNSEVAHHLPSTAAKVRKARGVRANIITPRLDDTFPDDVPPEHETILAASLFALGEWTVQAIRHLLENEATT